MEFVKWVFQGHIESRTQVLTFAQIDTPLSPIELLDELQSVENKMGRVKIIDKGPRNIDLDILLHGNEIFSNDRLQIPHKLMLEREFVLRPLCE